MENKINEDKTLAKMFSQDRKICISDYYCFVMTPVALSLNSFIISSPHYS